MKTNVADAVARALALLVLALTLAGCAMPLRFDPHRQELERKQNECLARGGTPPDCRP